MSSETSRPTPANSTSASSTPASPTAHRYAVADHAGMRLSDIVLRWESILVILLALVVFANSLLSPYFLDIDNLSDTTFNFSEKAIIALAMALLIVVREIDLSVAATVALCSLIMGLASQAGVGTVGLVLTGLAVGAACGAVNGVLVTGIGLPSIVVTIGTMSLYRGIAQVVLGDQAITTYSAAFQNLGQGYLFLHPPVPLSFAIFLGLAVAFAIVLHGTVIGRQLYAIGNNPTAARYSGIAVNKIRLSLFVVAGLAAGMAAVLLTARIGSTRPNIALGWELEAVTMVVLGGVSITGGSGSIGGVVLAVFVLGMATFGLSLINVPGIVINVLLGLLLITALAAPIVARRLIARHKAKRGSS